MNVSRGVAVLMLTLAACAGGARAQGIGAFDIEAYRAFLSAHRDLTHEGLTALHTAGTFARSVPAQALNPARVDRIRSLCRFRAGTATATRSMMLLR